MGFSRASFNNAPRINNAQIFAFVERDWGVITKRVIRHQRLLGVAPHAAQVRQVRVV
jgi:hypothetical protein